VLQRRDILVRQRGPVKTVGLVGGLGPESTIDYYRRILATWAVEEPDSSPSIVIDSLDTQIGLRLVATDLPAMTDYLAQSIRRLEGAGVDFIAMAANTAHIVFDDLTARARVPLLSIVETCAVEARRLGLKRLGLLGTRFTMEASFYPSVFARDGMRVFPPEADERLWLHERYVGQLLKGDFREETRDGVQQLVRQLRERHDLDGIIFGGTELPLLLRSRVVEGLPALDTTVLHVDEIVRKLHEVG
jgi:aspartate racemase